MKQVGRLNSRQNQSLQHESMNKELFDKIVSTIQEFIVMHSGDFDLELLFQPAQATPVERSTVKVFHSATELCKENGVEFDHHWYWIVAWRHALSLENLQVLAQTDTIKVINTFHPRCHEALKAIFEHGLGRYMRWYPWRWFHDLTLIGAGGFSAVYQASVNLPYDIPEEGCDFGSHKRQVALKVVDEKILNEIVVQSRAFLTLLFHGLAVCESTGDLLMIGTLAENNLEYQIARSVGLPHDLTQQARIVSQLAFHLASLHDDVGMCHRNIHPGNVLCENDECFLVDYRFSTSSSQSSAFTQKSMAHYGRVPYIAPEVRQGMYTEKSDVYSLGIIMWQLISCVEFPPPEIMRDAPDIYKVERVPGVPEWYQQVMTACLEPHPEHRPDAEEVGLVARAMALCVDKLQFNEDWAPYATRRREECRKHRQRWSSSVQADLTVEQGAGHSQELTASRMFTLDEIPPVENLIALAFHHQQLDTGSL